MALTPGQTLTIILSIAAGTQLCRWLPFLLFPEGKDAPPAIQYLGRLLPAAAMGLLVVYCLRSVSLSAPPHGLPEALSIALVVILHCWRRNVLLSILGGTALYMLLIQTVFV